MHPLRRLAAEPGEGPRAHRAVEVPQGVACREWCQSDGADSSRPRAPLGLNALSSKGGREGNIVMADITYPTLAKPLGASPPWYKARAPYTDALLARAITQGLDSSGQQLDASMPRWVLSESELQDLLKYLKRLGSR